MTVLELVERDLKKAEINLHRAKNKPNAPRSELEHLEHLVAMRAKICAHIATLGEADPRTAFERMRNAGLDDVLLFDNPSYDDALIGVTEDDRAVYDFDKMVAWLVEHDGMTVDEAWEWIEFNTIRALPYHGDRAPIIVYLLQ